jgi:PAS domain S-box-containing protein
MTHPLRKAKGSQIDLLSLQESIYDGLLIVNPYGKIVSFNQRFIKIWNIPNAILATRDDNSVLRYVRDQLKNPESFMHKVYELYADPESESFDVLEFKDNRIIERYSHPLRAHHQILGRVWSFRDVTAQKLTEQSLQESEEKFRILIETAGEGIWVLDADDRVIFVNGKMAELLDYPTQEMIGRSIYSFLDREGMHLIQERLEKGSQRIGETIEVQFIRKSGLSILAMISVSPIFSPEGKYRGAFGMVKDVSDRVKVIQQLRHSHKELEMQVKERTHFLTSILENIPDMIFVKDAKTLRFVQFNRAGEALLGYGRSQLIGKSDYDFFPKDQADFFTKKDREVLQKKGATDIPEETIDTRHLGLRILHTKKIPIYDPEGKPKYLLGISEDITVRKKAEEEKRAREDAERAKVRSDFLSEISKALSQSLDVNSTLMALVRHLVPAFADWCFVACIEKEGRIRVPSVAHVNSDREDLIRELGQYIPDRSARDEKPDFFRIGKTVVLLNVSRNMFCLSSACWPLFGTKDRKWLEIISELDVKSYVAVPLTTRGRITGAIMMVSTRDPHRYNEIEVALAEDIAVRTALAIDNAGLYEEAQLAIHIREDFISIASHELRTPLTPLKAQLQLIHRICEKGVDQFPRDQVEKLAGMADRDVVRLNRLVENLLDVSRIGAGRLSLNREQMDLTKAVKSVIERFQYEVQNVKSKIEFEGDPHVEGFWDRLRIEQVLTNLVSNAIKFGQGKPILISVKAGKERATLKVHDMGIGISKENHGKIFERFERAVSERQFGGLGLGLYITQQIVKEHGGKICVESEVGQGTTFIVDLPQLRK